MRFEKQARAILDNQELNQILYGTKSRPPYQWHGLLMRFRLNPEWGRMYARSAADHGISLTASYRPFEHALMKYYVVPVFDHAGRFLWNFLPGANPTVNFDPDQVSFAHYRQILRQAGKTEHAKLASLTLAAVPESRPQKLTHEDLRIYAAKAPPIALRSFVLVRDEQGKFDLRRFEEIADRVHSQRIQLNGWSLETDADGSLQINELHRPADHRYLIIQGRSPLRLPVELPVVARSAAGSRLGRITAGGSYRTDFQAIEHSFRLVRRGGKALRPIGDDEIVVDFGADWSPEMMDYHCAAARRLALREIKTMLAAPAFDEIFINTRSHTQLAGSNGDGELGVQTIGHHRRRRKNYHHLGIDRAYAPLSSTQSPPIRSLIRTGTHAAIEKITDWQRGEWMGACQDEAAGYPWRLSRNLSVAKGIRLSIRDLENEFPATRIRVMIPPRSVVSDSVSQALETLSNPAGGTYDTRYYRFLQTGLNHIPAIGEGMSMIDLSGLRAEPVFLGLRHLPDPGPVALHLDAYLQDQSGNHGSAHRGPKSFFYEAQYTLREKDKTAAAKRREEIIRDLLNRPEINEVILYEAANWTYDLPVDNPHRYLDSTN